MTRLVAAVVGAAVYRVNAVPASDAPSGCSSTLSRVVGPSAPK